MLRHCNEEDYRNISELLDDSTRAIINDEIGEEYSHDELGSLRMAPEVVVKAMSTEEVSRVLAYANCEHIPVTPRGAGTGLVGAAVPALGGIVLDLSEMNRILELDQDNLTVTVEPGVLLMTLAAYTEENDFLYPPDPPILNPPGLLPDKFPVPLPVLQLFSELFPCFLLFSGLFYPFLPQQQTGQHGHILIPLKDSYTERLP